MANPHGGAFKHDVGWCWSHTCMIDRALLSSARTAAAVQGGSMALHVLHDRKRIPPNATYRGVRLHFARALIKHQGVEHWTGNDARFPAYAQYLDMLGLPPSACVWLVDLSDVRIVGNPADLCGAAPHALHMGSDNCRGASIRAWLARHSATANYSLSSSMRRYLAPRRGSVHKVPLDPLADDETVPNSGILGGTWRVLRPYLHAVVQRMRSHYASLRPVGIPLMKPSYPIARYPIDMLVTIEEARRRQRANGQQLRLGYPLGRVNLPMWSRLCADDEYVQRHAAAAALHCSGGVSFEGGGCEKCAANASCTAQTIRTWQAESHFVFSHKSDVQGYATS
jgi:hypothetical protein